MNKSLSRRSKFSVLLALLFPIITLPACAPRASAVAPVAVSSSDYSDLSCKEAKTLLTQKRGIENALTKRQNNAALGDAAGVFLILLPLGTVFGADVEGELAIAKGDVDALERLITVDC